MSAVRCILSLVSLLFLPALANAQDPKPVREPAPVRNREKPPGPAKVTARIVDVTRVLVSWDSVPGAEVYHVGRHAPPNGWQRVATVPGNVREVADTGRNLSGPHTYSVVAVINDLASKATVSEPVQGGIQAGGPGTANSPEPGCYSEGGPFMRCQLTKVWGGAHGGEIMQVGCPVGYDLLSGGYNGRFTGYHVLTSMPIVHEGKPKWYVYLAQVQGATVPATQRQELSVVAMCRRVQ